VTLFERFQSLLARLATYPRGEVVIELLLIGAVVFALLKFVQGTRAAGALKGLLLLLVLSTIASRLMGGSDTFARLELLYDKFLALFAVALIVIFQPELRRALVRLGETPFLRGTPKDIKYVVNEVTSAASYLSRAKFGAIIAIERQIGLTGIIEGGTVLNAELTSRLLQTIFFPGSALHDLAVVIRGRTIYAAGVQLPLAEPADMPEEGLGSRHRAGVGLSKECDAIVVVVSEETGGIRIAERGRLSERFTAAQFRTELELRLTNAMKRPSTSIAPDVSSADPQFPQDRVAMGTTLEDDGNPNHASLAGGPGLSEDIDARGARS
jgi:diadenylate cyclase